MFDRQCQLEQARGQIKLDEIGAHRDLAIDTGVIAAVLADGLRIQDMLSTDLYLGMRFHADACGPP